MQENQFFHWIELIGKFIDYNNLMVNKNILLTGAAGFIGSNLTKLLLDNGFFVLGIDNFNNSYSPALKRNNIKDYLRYENYKLLDLDFRYLDKMDQIFCDFKPSVVIHLGARAGVHGSLKEPQEYSEVNVTGTINLLELSVKHKVEKFIFASSSSVYGGTNTIPFKEDDQSLKPLSPYAASKLAGEHFCSVYSYLYHLPIIVLRFFTVYGPNQRPDLSIFKFARAIDQEEYIEIYGDGSARRDFTYIMDTLDGIMKSISYTKSQFEIFNLGESKNYSLKEVIETLETYIGRRAKIKYSKFLPFDVKKTHADINKARKLLRYNPTTDLKDGLKIFTEWYLRNKQIFIGNT